MSSHAYIQALTGQHPDEAVLDFRAIHDKRKDVPAHHFRGTFTQLHPLLTSYNKQGYGIFCNINALDGHGRELTNISHIRAHVVDLDNPLNSQANLDRAANTTPVPHFYVQTSPGKYHIYWLVEPYTGNDFYTLHQRKLRQLYDGDRNVIDATRVLRIPGFLHQKGEPFEVTLEPLAGLLGPRIAAADLQQALAGVNVIENYGGSRSPLGDPTMAAPSLEWLKFAVRMVDPNQLARDEWLSFTAAIKQSGWNHADDATLFAIWSEWCAQYNDNNPGENIKLWNSIRDTEVGWSSIERRTSVKAYMSFGFPSPPQQQQSTEVTVTQPDMTDTSGEILEGWGCREWFKNCYFINRTGQIFSAEGRFMNSTQFNGKYGGKHFVITSTGKVTDEAWKAA